MLFDPRPRMDRLVLLVLLLCTGISLAQATNPTLAGRTPATVATGDGSVVSFPRIKAAGGVLGVDILAEKPSASAMHRLLIDITDDKATPDGTNVRLDLAARALNLYAMAGVPDDKVRVAILLHGKGIALALSDAAFAKKFGRANPNSRLIAQLRAAGVELFVCGQALGHQGFTAADVRSEVRLTLSALTKREELQAAGYGAVP